MLTMTDISRYEPKLRNIWPKYFVIQIKLVMKQAKAFYHCQVYTDGACTNNGKANAKAGIGVFWSNRIGSAANKLNVSEPIKGIKATNNTGEIQAITRSIEQAIDQVNLYTKKTETCQIPNIIYFGSSTFLNHDDLPNIF